MIREAIIKSMNIFEQKIPKSSQGGTCYVDAYEYMSANPGKKSLRLVHGLVTGQGAIEGVRYNHAWVEDGNTVIDAAKKALGARMYEFPKDLYYAIGQIDKKTTFYYNIKTMMEKMYEIETYGPWEPILIKNKY